EAFRLWAGRFLEQAASRGWLPSARLPAFLAERIGAGELRPEPRLRLAGFEELTPAQLRLLEAAAASGASVEMAEPPEARPAGEAVRVGWLDAEREIRAAARWARARLEETPAAMRGACRIGIVVPGLEAVRARVERVFASVFHPGAGLGGEQDAERAFNISAGPRLAAYPVVEAALEILGLGLGRVPFERLARLLGSPF